MGKWRVYCLKTLKKLSIYPLGKTPSAPSVYGLKQAGRQWYKSLKEQLKKFGLVQIVNNPHTFVVQWMFASKLKTLIVPVYVDDLLPMGDRVLVENFVEYLPKVFKMSSAGAADFFLGLRIE